MKLLNKRYSRENEEGINERYDWQIIAINATGEPDIVRNIMIESKQGARPQYPSSGQLRDRFSGIAEVVFQIHPHADQAEQSSWYRRHLQHILSLSRSCGEKKARF